MILNLQNKSASDVQYELSKFPDGQPHVKVDVYEGQQVDVVVALRSMDDFANLALVCDVLQHRECKVRVFVSYFLGARMDRRIDGAQPDTLDCMVELFDHCIYEGTDVYVLDPHSDVLIGKLEETRSRSGDERQAVMPIELVKHALASTPRAVIVVPDEGAVQRIDDILDGIPSDFEHLPHYSLYVRCKKVRDSQTGKLCGFAFADGDSAVVARAAGALGATFLIIDDICDGGGTFSGIADVLHSVAPKAEVRLCVTHGLFTKGLPIAGISHVYTTDSAWNHSALPTCWEVEASYIDVLRNYMAAVARCTPPR